MPCLKERGKAEEQRVGKMRSWGRREVEKDLQMGTITASPQNHEAREPGYGKDWVWKVTEGAESVQEVPRSGF